MSKQKQNAQIPQRERKVSQFASSPKQNKVVNKQQLEEQLSGNSLNSDKSSNNGSQKDQLIENNKMHSYKDVMKEQEELLKQKGVVVQKKNKRRDSVQSMVSEQLDSQSDDESEFDEQGSPEMDMEQPESDIADVEQQLTEPQQDTVVNDKKDEKKDEKKDLKLKKNESKKSNKSKKDPKKNIKGSSKKPGSQKSRQVYRNDDFTIKNSVGRNILHRQCLKQNFEIILDLLIQFRKLKKEEVERRQFSKYQTFDEPQFTAEEMIEQYINSLDRFGNSPLILCCIEELEGQDRYKCLQILLIAGADVNHRNPRTLWSAVHWCAHYGDDKCLGLLLSHQKVKYDENILNSYLSNVQQNPSLLLQDNPSTMNLNILQNSNIQTFQLNPSTLSINLNPSVIGIPNTTNQEQKIGILPMTYCCFPDQEGYFPIDLAGQNGSQESVNIFLQSLISEIKEIEKNPHLYNPYLGEEEITFYQTESDQKFMKQQRVKYLKSPILKSRILYWAAYCPSEQSMSFIKDTFGFNQIYIMARQPHQSSMTSLHAAAKNKNKEILQFLAVNIRYKNSQDKTKWMEKQQQQRAAKEFAFSIRDNTVLSMIHGEDQIYKSYFIKNIKEFASWENEFILTHRKYMKNNTRHTFIDQKDQYGNTALHLASINGFSEGVQILLDNGADMETENKEGWRPRELVQHPEIRKRYQKALESNQGLTEQLKKMNEQLGETINKYNQVDSEQVSHANKQREKDLYAFGTKLFLPDFVIVFQLAKGKQLESNLNRMNFQITVLKKSKFNVYLLESVIPDRFYLLIGMNEKNLQSACKDSKMQMKLIDSYDYEPYNNENITKFEPFRSKQRQEILEMYLNKIVNLQDLKSQKLISSYYKMHTYGGISRIKYQWVDAPSWYWPQPLNQLDDYLLEDKSQNFTSVTLLRQYFGEKIAFFFGWKSFITCFMILIAIPGLALQIYIILEKSEDYNNILISFWVFYVMIWSTIIVEFWKRKTSEINYRWGTLDQMNNPDLINKTVREDFIGDECISAVTGGLTKFQIQSKTVIKFIFSIPVLVFLMGLVVYIFLKIDEFKKSFTDGPTNNANNNLYKTLAGVLQGVSIQILNFIYTVCARYFAKEENHKYIFQYERSIIYKLMAFKVLNSYFALFYIGFVQTESNFSTLFFMLLPIMLIKQVNYTLFNVWLPIFLYKRAEKKYFQNVRKAILDHQLVQGDVKDKLLENQDIIETYWNDISNVDMENLSRAVISLQEVYEGEDNDNKLLKQEMAPSIRLIRHIDVDSIELNSLRQEFSDTVNFYADSFIDIGYITLFASAFPIGPFIGMMMNSLEIRNKLNVFMYVLKRPACERCAGIGDWLFIWECFSFVSVISNIGLLYYKDEKLLNLILDDNNYSDQERSTYKTWIYIGLGIAIIFLKYMFQAFIPDKPEWIRKEEEKFSYQEQIQKEKDERLLQINKQDKEEEQKKVQKQMGSLKIKNDAEITVKDELILDLQDDVNHYIKNCPNEIVQSRIHKGGKSQLKNSSVFKIKSEFQLKVFGVLRSTYIKIERELLIQRMKQLETMNIGTIMICNECGKKLSVFECQLCDLTFCQQCFDEYHTLINKIDHPIKILNKKNKDHLQFQNYMVTNKGDEEHQSLLEQKVNPEEHTINSPVKTHGQKEEKWRKFEYFVLPTYKKSPLFNSLKDMFGYFKSEYIDQNGIDEGSENIDFKKVFKLKERQDLKAKDGKLAFSISESKYFQLIINSEEFNIEDKLFLNRIAFLIFKRYGQKSTFQNFYNICKILQEGFSEQKFILLLEFIDEDDSQMIDREEIKKIFYSSFLQTSEEEKKIDSIVNDLFKEETQMSKVEIGKKFIYSSELDPVLHSFLISLLQDRKS